MRTVLLRCNGGMAEVVCDSIFNAHHGDVECGVGEGVWPRVLFCEVRHCDHMMSVAGVVIALRAGRKNTAPKRVDVCAGELRSLLTEVKHSAAQQRDYRRCVFGKVE